MPQIIDVSGQTFGRLTVLRRAESRLTPGGQRKTYWLCECVCGKTVEANSQNLRVGNIRSCGCLNADSNRARGHQLAGQRFGRLEVLRKGETLSDESTTWVCRCDCGITRPIRTSLLISGNALSCGCLQALMSAHRRWLGSEVGYFAMHDRLRSKRGPAKNYPCVDCGGSARDWSYDGCDPSEKTELVGGYPLAFSTSPDHYAPRCSSCHRRHDVGTRRKESA